MLSTLKHPWRRALLQAGVLYAICVAALLWLLPPPVHFQFSSDRDGRLFSPTTEPALVRLASDNKHPTSIQESFIEHVDLHTGNIKRIRLDPGDKRILGVKDYIKSHDGSLFVVAHPGEAHTVSLWEGHSGKLRCLISSDVNRWEEIAVTLDNSRIALSTFNNAGAIDLYDAKTGKRLGQLQDTRRTFSKHAWDLLFSLDGRYLSCLYAGPGIESSLTIFDTTTLAPMNEVANEVNLAISHEVLPAPNGFWISQWDRSEEKLTLSFLNAQTGERTILDSELSSRLAGFPHIFSDNTGHLYLIQSRKLLADDWQKRTRTTILGWLKKLGFDWETTDEIVLRHISPDGKRLISEQTCSANYAEISSNGQYLILMSQMKNDSRYVVYHYPTHLNWKHSLLWPLIPAMLLLLIQRWRQHGRNRNA